MNDHPMLFSGPMIRALVEGRKTQTRRVWKGPVYHKPEPHSITPCGDVFICRWQSGIRHDVPMKIKMGDRIWIKEAWRSGVRYDNLPPRNLIHHEAPIRYAADEPLSAPEMVAGKTRASIHMPRWASRITLLVTDVRVERVQDISKEDCIAEGLDRTFGSIQTYCDYEYAPDDFYEWFSSPHASFASLWRVINGPDSWHENPWVVAYTFDVVKQNIDQIGA